MGVSDQALVSGRDVFELIPQRPPMVLIDRLVSVDETCACTDYTVDADHLFVENGIFTEPGIIEHVAQSCAARIGYICRREGIPVPVGFIGAISHFSFYFLPRVGDVLRTEVCVEQELFEVTLVLAKVYVGEQQVAEGYLKIALQKH